MKNEFQTDLAQARQDNLVIRDLGDEVLVYDQSRDKAHCLNKSAAAVWKRCDGYTTPAEIARLLQNEFGAAIDERFVWLALKQLGRDHLLEQQIEWPTRLPQLSRREAVRRLGLGAAIALPLVISITAPVPAEAATCRAPGTVCQSPAQCCSGICNPGSPPRCL